MLSCPPGERGVAGEKKEKMIEVRAVQTERALSFDQSDPVSLEEFLAALGTSPIPVRHKDQDLFFRGA